MAVSANGRFTPGNLDVLNALLDSAGAALRESRPTKPSTSPYAKSPTRPLSGSAEPERAGIFFTGNPHEAVPRRLLLDNRLTPLERNAWQVLRLLLNDDGLTSFPTYEQLRPYLASSPFKQASKESIAKALTALRMTRWLSLGGKVRDNITGQMKGNIYLLHDEPVSIAEAMLLDGQYLELIGTSICHANRSIQELAAHVLEELAADPYSRENALPTHLEKIQQRVKDQKWHKPKHDDQADTPTSKHGSSESELSKARSELRGKPSVRSRFKQGSESEPCPFIDASNQVRNPNSFSTGTDTHLCKSTVPATREPLRLPSAFLELAMEQRQKIKNALSALDEPLQQSVLDQWSLRCTDPNVRNPAGYLFGMIQKAKRGEFNALADASKAATSIPSRNGLGTPPPKSQPSLGHVTQRDKPRGQRLATGQDCMNEIWLLLKSKGVGSTSKP